MIWFYFMCLIFIWCRFSFMFFYILYFIVQHFQQSIQPLDISVFSTAIYCISPSIILQIPFTVNNCNTLCIMDIFCDVGPHIQRLTVFFLIAVSYCICCNGLFGAILLRSFYFPNFLHLDWHNLPYVSTAPQQLGIDCYVACINGQIRLSFMSETARARSTSVRQ